MPAADVCVRARVCVRKPYTLRANAFTGHKTTLRNSRGEKFLDNMRLSGFIESRHFDDLSANTKTLNADTGDTSVNFCLNAKPSKQQRKHSVHGASKTFIVR